MRGMWKRILPHCANTDDFEEETVIQRITNIGRELGFDELENDDVHGLLKSHSEVLTDDDPYCSINKEHLKKPATIPKYEIMCK